MHIAHTAFGFLVKMPETAQTPMTLAYFPAVFLILIKGQSATNTVYKHFGAHWIGWDIALVYQAICARQKHQVDKWQDLFYYLFSHANFIMEGHNNSYLFELKGIRTTKVNCTKNIKQSWLDWLRIVCDFVFMVIAAAAESVCLPNKASGLFCATLVYLWWCSVY